MSNQKVFQLYFGYIELSGKDGDAKMAIIFILCFFVQSFIPINITISQRIDVVDAPNKKGKNRFQYIPLHFDPVRYISKTERNATLRMRHYLCTSEMCAVNPIHSTINNRFSKMHLYSNVFS